MQQNLAFRSAIQKIINIRNLLIIEGHVGQTYFIHSGKSFVKLKIRDRMKGYKFGDFIHTSKYPVYAKNKKKKQKKGKKRK